MKEYTVGIEGMACGMCEAHICDRIRGLYPRAKKVSASRKKREATFLYDGEVEEEQVKAAITDAGYVFLSLTSREYKKRGLFG